MSNQDNQKLVAVGVGYVYNLFPEEAVAHIDLRNSRENIVGPDGNVYQLLKGSTFAESQKVDALLDAYGENRTTQAREAYREQVLSGSVGKLVSEGIRSENGLYDFEEGRLVVPEVLDGGLVIGAYVYDVPASELYDAGEDGRPQDPTRYVWEHMEDTPGFKADRGWIPAERGLRLTDADFTKSRFYDEVCAFVAIDGGVDRWVHADARSIHEATQAAKDLYTHPIEREHVEIYDSERFSDLSTWKEEILSQISNGYAHWVEQYGTEATLDDITDEDASFLAEMDQQDDFESFVSELDGLADGHTLVALGQRGLWNGTQVSGFLADSTQELVERAMQGGCEDLSVHDESGELHISASHHDGTNGWEVRILDDAGEDMLGELEDGDDPDFMKLWENARKPEYARHCYGMDGTNRSVEHERDLLTTNRQQDTER